MKIFFNVLIPLLITCQYLHSQHPDPLRFFPHHQGDVWEYVDPQGRNPEQNIILKDTLGPDGKYYLETTMLGKMCIDTATFEVRSNTWGGFTYNTLLFKLGADSGDSWTAWREEPFPILKAVVVDVYQLLVFGNVTTVKEINYVDSASRLLFDTYYIASGFGIIRQDIDATAVMIVRGAIINGIRYGTVDVKNEENILPPRQFVLYDNYPNPFNSSTTIQYDLPERTYVRLTVHDVLGREVAGLVEQMQIAGRYHVTFEANNIPSGVYLYRLQTTQLIQERVAELSLRA